MRDFFRLIRRYPERIELHWDKVELPLIRTYQQLGCKLGDATIAAHQDGGGEDRQGSMPRAKEAG
jgi:hypothetical protein